MAQLPNQFDANTINPNTAFEPLPAGWYNVMITDSEMKQTKAGTGYYLQLTLQVLDGQYANRKLFERLNLVNPNPTAQEIAQQTLSAICHATGVLQITDSVQLHNKPMAVKTTVKHDEQYGDKNEIKGYKATEAQQAPPAQAPSATNAQGAPVSAPPPWGGAA